MANENVFPVAECVIKSVKEPRNLAKMASTFGTWLKDTAVEDDERIWVAEHFSGTSSDSECCDGADLQSV